MNFSDILAILGIIIAGIGVFFGWRSMIYAQEAVKWAKLPFDREKEAHTLNLLEEAIISAIVNSQKKTIYYSPHLEGRPAIVFETKVLPGASWAIPGHEPISDEDASLERLISHGFIELSEPAQKHQINLSTKPNHIYTVNFCAVRLTHRGRQVAKTLDHELSKSFLASNGLEAFKSRG